MKTKAASAKINVQGTEIAVVSREDEDYVSLTDIVRNFDGGPALIEQWLKNKDTVLFLGVWEQLNNPDFKTPEFEGIKNEAGRNSFYLSAKKASQRHRHSSDSIQFLQQPVAEIDNVQRDEQHIADTDDFYNRKSAA